MTRVAAVLLACALLGACGYQEGVIQKADMSYLKFIGNWPNATVQIDDMPPFILTPSANSASPPPAALNTLYQVAPGKHRVTVTRGGAVLVDRVLLLDNHATMEVQIP
jgi:hypothetical protein